MSGRSEFIHLQLLACTSPFFWPEAHISLLVLYTVHANIAKSHILVGTALPASNFKAYYVARFSKPFKTFGISHHGHIDRGVGETRGEGEVLAGWVSFEEEAVTVDVKVGVSFISVEQAGR